MKEVQLKVAVWTSIKAYKYSLFYRPFDNGLPLYNLDDPDLGKRMTELEAALQEAKTWLDAPDGGMDTLRIFAAPEYTLVNSKADDTERAVSYEDFKQMAYETKLAKLSTGLLLLPGTVLWKKPLVSEKPFNLDDARVTGAMRQVLTKKRDKLAQLKATDGQSIQYVRNVALIYYDGERIFKYKKRAEYKAGRRSGELSSGDKERKIEPAKRKHVAIKFLPGHKEGVFGVKLGNTVITCGIEICADHAGANLVQTSGAQNIHLQFILSDHVSNLSPGIAVKEGGYIIHASTDTDVSGLFDHQFKRTGESHSVTLPNYGQLSLHRQILRLPS